MPTRWTEQAKFNLLFKIIEQNPVKIDFQSIVDNWPGPETFTARACEEQWKLIRKGFSFKTKVSKTTSTPATPTTPGTPSSRKVAATNVTPRKSLTTPTKRSINANSASITSVKKRKLKHGPEASEEEEETNFDETDESDSGTPLANASDTIAATRTLPARSKSRSKSYTIDNDSAGGDAGARELDSDDDTVFDPVKDAESKLTKKELREKRRAQVKQGQREKGMTEAAGAAEEEKVKGADGSMAAFGNGRSDAGAVRENGNTMDKVDVASNITSPTTTTTSWKSALEHMNDSEEN